LNMSCEGSETESAFVCVCHCGLRRQSGGRSVWGGGGGGGAGASGGGVGGNSEWGAPVSLAVPLRSL